MAETAPEADDVAALRAFRSAALQIRNASVISDGSEAWIQVHADPDGARTTFQVLAEEPFRSLAISVRLVYLQKEPANFLRVCNILHRRGSAKEQTRVAEYRRRYKQALGGKYVQFKLHGQFEGEVAGPRRILEAWLHGVAFHQDEEKREVAVELAKYQSGDAFPFAVNMIVLRLAGVVLDLDDVVADHLREERVPRIQPSA